jgi:hypoxanthine phosphoribosyltransferase
MTEVIFPFDVEGALLIVAAAGGLILAAVLACVLGVRLGKRAILSIGRAFGGGGRRETAAASAGFWRDGKWFSNEANYRGYKRMLSEM